MFDIQRNFDSTLLPDGEYVFCFQFPDLKEYRKWWLLSGEGDVDICYDDPGKDIDLYVTAELRTLTDIYMADLDLEKATRSGALKVIGDTQLERRLSKWFPISEAAVVPRVTKQDT